ncbi:MAG: hypothetical protein ABSE48_14585 [Verrucomicrobiota bacterium]|jgi:hypothetical protein
MNLTSSLKARLVEILITLPPRERKIVLEELQEAVRIICLHEGFSPAELVTPHSSIDTNGGYIQWN